MKRWILSIGVNDYGSQINLPNLNNAVNDACLIYKIFTQYYNFEGMLLTSVRDVSNTKHIDLVKQIESNGTREDIIESINKIKRYMDYSDLFVLFFAGHGISQSPGYIMPYGTEWGKPSTYLMYRNLYGILRALPCRCQALFFDCCYSGVAMENNTVTNRYAFRGINAPRVVAFSATDKNNVTLDKFPEKSERKNSPFSYALARYLKNKIKEGDTFDPDKYYVFLKTFYQKWIPENFSKEPIIPQYKNEMPEIRSGNGELLISRPGLRLTLPVYYETNVGEDLNISLASICSLLESSELEFDFIPHEQFIVEHNEKMGNDKWKIRLKFPGFYAFDVVVKDSKRKEDVSKTFYIKSLPPKSQEIRIHSGFKEICFKNSKYETEIYVKGGISPFKWEIQGLPEQFHWDTNSDSSTININGFIQEDIESISPHSFYPIAYDIRISVIDSMKNSCKASRCLLIISNEDYCKLGGKNNPFIVGYQSTNERDQAIHMMLRKEAEIKITTKKIQLNGQMETFFKKVINELWIDLKKQALDCNPASKVSLQEFYIKKYPVTNKEWSVFVETCKSEEKHNHIPDYWTDGSYPPGKENYPVVSITYESICSYLQWKGTRLPTAWEWERAARGIDGRLFPWGDEFDLNKCNMQVLEKNDEQELSLTRVNKYDSFYPEYIQVRDIVGNAAEWVDRRVYQPGGYFAQVFRGGSFLDSWRYALTFLDSKESPLVYDAEQENSVSDRTKTNFRWVGFRDVVDLNVKPDQPQKLVRIPESTIIIDRKKVSIKSFQMAIYTVSNQEYLEFVTATGHPLPLSWNFSSPFFPMNKSYLPVVNISFYDAMAFCLWKSRKVKQIIRLPSYEQWLAAATGKHPFPWGDSFDLQKCNSQRSGWGRRLPVFSLAEGRTKNEGIYNMIGNINEWIQPDKVAGGSWQDNCNLLKNQNFIQRIKSKDLSSFYRNDIGFRYIANDFMEDNK